MKTVAKIIVLLSLIITLVCLWSLGTGKYIVGWRYLYGSEFRSYDDKHSSSIVNESIASDHFPEDVESKTDRVLHRFDVRRRHVMDLCSRGLYNKNTTMTTNTHHFIVVDEHKLLYCYVPKIGCSNWKRLILVMTGRAESLTDVRQNDPHSPKYKTLADVKDVTEAEKILKTYTKVMILREPMSRIVSVYKDKFERNTQNSIKFREQHVRHIIKKYRDHPVDVALIKGNNSITFRELAQYLGDSENTFSIMSEAHWRETYRICSPCEVGYDYIGHFDTLTEDSNTILKSVLNLTLEYPVSTNPTNSSHGSVMQDFFNQINSTELKRLQSRFRVDSMLFDSA